MSEPPIVLDEYLFLDVVEYRGDELRTIATLALHGQPFGFGPHDVGELRKAADQLSSDGWFHNAEHLRSLAARIEALLASDTQAET